jgi:hypothetical protein
VLLRERLTVALLSQSQSSFLEGRCPPQPLDGGVPVPEGDAGVLAPDSTESGFDAVRACGVLVNTLLPAEGCLCPGCSITYEVSGVRR